MKKKDIPSTRRKFLQTAVAGIGGVALGQGSLHGSDRTEKERKEDRPFLYRTLGKTGLKLPVISLGVMNCDNPALVKAALDAGIIHLDTANYYMRGKNETMIGEVVKGRPRDSFVLATKVLGDHMSYGTGLFTEKTKAGPFIEKFETSLKRLQMDYVDILYLHNVMRGEAALFEPLMKAMIDLKKAGKTRFIGVSTHMNEPEVIRAAIESKVYDVVLTAYCAHQAHWKEVRDAIAQAAKAGLGVVAMKTIAGTVYNIGKTIDVNAPALMKWALQDENVHTTVPGCTTFDQLEENLNLMAGLTLTAEEKAYLASSRKEASLYCNGCRECLASCPADLPIPDLMRACMYLHGYRNLAAARETLENLKLPDGPVPCSNCSACTARCAKGFQVREKVLNVARLLDVPEDFIYG